MKKILYILASVALLAACNSDFLDKKPLDKLSEEAVFGHGGYRGPRCLATRVVAGYG